MVLTTTALRRARLLGAAAAAATVLASCPDRSPYPHDAYDGGPDAGRRDSGRDVGLDAPNDARVPRDFGPDTNTDGGPDDPVWVPLPGLPDGCTIERAAHPERLPGLSWASCGTGCLRAEFEPTTENAGFGNARFSDGRGYIATISVSDGGARNVFKLMPVDGAPIAAWRSVDIGRADCWVAWGAVAEGYAAAVTHWISDSQVTLVEERVYRAPLSEIASIDLPEAVVQAPYVGMTRAVDSLVVGRELVAMHVAPGPTVLIERGGAIVSTSLNGWDPAVEGDHVVWAEAGGPWRLWHWTPESGAEVYFEEAEPVTDVLLDQGTLVWTRPSDFVDGFATRAELWTSPFARTPAGVTPRMVHRDAGNEYARFGDGIYLAVRGTGTGFTAQLTDLADGRVRMLGLPEPGIACSYPHYVSSTEVLLDCGRGGATPMGLYYRIDPRTLPYQ